MGESPKERAHRRELVARSRRLVAEGKLSLAYSAELLDRSAVILADAGRARTGPGSR